jgi:hypothetical protein
MWKEAKFALLSLVAGCLTLAFLYSLGMLSARYDWAHPGSMLGLLGYLLLSFLTLPLFGAQQPSVWWLLMTAAIDVWFLSLPICLLSYAWRHRRNSN